MYYKVINILINIIKERGVKLTLLKNIIT